jgi:arginine decarboxylase
LIRADTPGVPVLAPGEVISADALDALRAALADGGRIAYAADPTLPAIQVARITGAAVPGDPGVRRFR